MPAVYLDLFSMCELSPNIGMQGLFFFTRKSKLDPLNNLEEYLETVST